MMNSFGCSSLMNGQSAKAWLSETGGLFIGWRRGMGGLQDGTVTTAATCGTLLGGFLVQHLCRCRRRNCDTTFRRRESRGLSVLLCYCALRYSAITRFCQCKTRIYIVFKVEPAQEKRQNFALTAKRCYLKSEKSRADLSSTRATDYCGYETRGRRTWPHQGSGRNPRVSAEQGAQPCFLAVLYRMQLGRCTGFLGTKDSIAVHSKTAPSWPSF